MLSGGAVLILKLAPQWLGSTDGLNPKDAAEEEGRIRTALLALLAGGLATVGAIYTGRSYALTKQGQITERFGRAVDQLGSDAMDVRLGGIYALERIARESEMDHAPIMEVLSAYVRERRSWMASPESTSPPPDLVKPASADVQAAITVLGRRTLKHDTGPPLNLAGVHIVRAQLNGLDFSGANLAKANLTEANLIGAHLNGSFLNEADLSRARLEQAQLRGAQLYRATVNHAQFENADLQDANFAEAELRSAGFQSAHLHEAIFFKARMESADFARANLEKANLVRANMAFTWLFETRLDGANLGGADLSKAEFDVARLNGAIDTPDTVWPEGFDAAAAGVVREGSEQGAVDT